MATIITTAVTVLPSITKPKRKAAEESSTVSPAKKAVRKPHAPRAPVPKAEGNCQVCCEKFNGTGNVWIECPRCPYRACKSCHQRYLLSSISAPHCMNCRNRWTYKNLLVLFKPSFINKNFRRQRGQYLLDRAKSHLPLAMPYASVENEIRDLDSELKPLLKEYHALRRDVRYVSYPSMNLKEREKKYGRYVELGNIVFTMSQKRRGLYARSYQARNRRRVETYTSFEEPCPVDDCRGFIEKCSQRCGICKTFVCRKCTKILGKVAEEKKDVPLVTVCSTIPVDDDELQQALDQIESLEKKDKMEKELKEYDDPMGSEVEEKERELKEYDDPMGSDVEEKEAENRNHTDETKNELAEIHPEDDEKLLSVSNLSTEEKKELRKLKKAHGCQQDDVDSVKEIRQHSRACPSCKARIFRISGCDTMWCTQCNTGFNWRTGMVIADAKDLHNPHYIDFVRHNPGFQYRQQDGSEQKNTNPAMPAIDNPCDRLTLETIPLPSAYTVSPQLSHLDVTLRTIITAFQQQMLHVRDYARTKFMHGNQYDETGYALRYVTKRWDEKRWKICIEHHHRFRETNVEYVDVIMTWLVVMNDLFAAHLTRGKPIPTSEAKHFIEQMRQISEYTNNALTEMNTLYKRKTNLIELPPDLKNETFMTTLWNRLLGSLSS